MSCLIGLADACAAGGESKRGGRRALRAAPPTVRTKRGLDRSLSCMDELTTTTLYAASVQWSSGAWVMRSYRRPSHRSGRTLAGKDWCSSHRS